MNFIIGEAFAPTRIYGGAIYVYDNAIPNWQDIIEGFEKEVDNKNSGVNYTLASTIDGRWDGARRNQILYITEHALKKNNFCRGIHNWYGELIETILKGYTKDFECGWAEHESYSLLKYQGATNDHYDAHYDGGPNNGRWISVIAYLNDDYEGGEIEFVHHGVKLKPKAGSFIVFPSNYAYRHIAHPVTSGTKYAIVSFIGGS